LPPAVVETGQDPSQPDCGRTGVLWPVASFLSRPRTSVSRGCENFHGGPLGYLGQGGLLLVWLTVSTEPTADPTGRGDRLPLSPASGASFPRSGVNPGCPFSWCG